MSTVFFSYSHKDEELRNQLEIHLAMLKRQGVIITWHDRRLPAGDAFDPAIRVELEQADIVLLLVSPDFLASEYCYSVEMNRALERQKEGSARVIPVILRPCDWKPAPFSHLIATPTDGKPVTKFPDRDDAFLEIAKAIRAAAGVPAGPIPRQPVGAPSAPVAAVPSGPRSSNLRVTQTFTQRDQDRFLDQTFQYIARFFENSLAELDTRYADLDTDFKEIDKTRITAVVYRNGAVVRCCEIRLGGMFGSGITYSEGTSHVGASNSINDSMTVQVGPQELSLAPMMPMPGSQQPAHLSQEGAAEYYWQRFIASLQR